MEESGWAPSGPSPFPQAAQRQPSPQADHGGYGGVGGYGGGAVGVLQPQQLQYSGALPHYQQPQQQQPWQQEPPHQYYQQQQQQQQQPWQQEIQQPWQQNQPQQQQPGQQAPPTYARQRLISGAPDAGEHGAGRDKLLQQKAALEQQILDKKQRKLEEQRKVCACER
jgi:hypothetical protein